MHLLDCRHIMDTAVMHQAISTASPAETFHPHSDSIGDMAKVCKVTAAGSYIAAGALGRVLFHAEAFSLLITLLS